MLRGRARGTWAPAITAVLVQVLGCGGADLDPPRKPAELSVGRPAAPEVQLSLYPSLRLYPPEPGRRKEIRLDVVHGIVDLGADGKLAAWSFAGQIPGPTVRLRAGDRVRLVVCNRSDEPLAGLTFDHGAQAIEMGGLLIDHDDERRVIAPGQTLTVELTAVAPGVHLYQGALPSEVEAVAAGLYGLVVVDPADGYATHADREYALVQSELFARRDPAGQRLAGGPLQILDPDAVTSKRPSHFGYGGHFATGGLRLGAEAGERVRLFLLNAGPFATGRFQMPGLAFDRVSPADVLGDKPGPSAPVTLGPGAGAIVELVVPRRGRYGFGDQQLASRGLTGIIDAAEGEPETPLVALKPPRTPAEKRERARALFVERCVSCHEPPPGTVRLAPDLTDVFKRRTRPWLTSWLTDPPKMQGQDPTAQELLRQWNNLPMPQVMLSAEQVDWMLEYLSDPARGKKS